MPTSQMPLLGAERPRVELRPAAVDTLGAEAAALATAAGIPPEPWQGDGLDVLLSTRPDGRWACYEFGEIVGRQQGKTSGIGVPRVLAGLFLLGERLILWSAHEYKTALEAFLRVKDALLELGYELNPTTIVIPDLGVTARIVNQNGEEGFVLSTGQRLRFVARSKGSGRGFSGDLVVIDEAFAYTRMQQSALEPTLSARPNPQVLYLSSPPLDGRSGAVLYALRTRAAAGDPTLGWRDWGDPMLLDELMRLPMAERAAILDDRDRWAATLPALGRGRSTEEATARLRTSLTDSDFAREVIGMWPKQLTADDGWSVIPREAWLARGGGRERPDGDVAFAIDAAWPDAATCSIVAAGRMGDDLTAQLIEHRPGTGWTVERVVELVDAHQPVAVVLDKRGPAGHLAEPLEAAGVDLLIPSTSDVAAAAGGLYAAIAGDAPSLRHYDQPEMAAAAQAALKRHLGDAWAFARQGEDDISPITATALAVWGLGQYAPMPMGGFV